MKSKDAMHDTYEKMELFDHTVLFTPIRIDRSTVPEGVYLYELRHSDDDWGEPVQLGKSVLVNHYGTVLSNVEIPLDADGFRRIEESDWGFTDSGTIALKDYLSHKPPIHLQAQALNPEDFSMCFSSEELDKTAGVIGHLRGDFGNGHEFFHSWFNHRPELNQEPFKSEFDKVVANLRAGPLQSFETMLAFCRANPQARIPDKYRSDPEFLLKLSTERFDYYTRLIPHKGDYNYYIYCADKNAREPERATPQKNDQPQEKKRQEPER